jgi:hypothetical protein
MSTSSRAPSYTSSPAKDFQDQLKRPLFPLILTKDKLQGVILQSPKGASMAACEEALSSMIEAGLIQRAEHFCTESLGTFLFVALRPIRSGSPRARKDQG